MSSTRLTPEKWIDAGFAALASLGPSGLAAEPLARQLGTTKGSFYWHFKDVPAFQTALIRHWHSLALSDVMERLGDSGPPDMRLRAFGHSILKNPNETALRVWAQSDKIVAASLAEVDAERFTYLNHLLRQFGLSNPAFGHAILASLIGLPQLQAQSDPIAAFDALVDTILALA
ncbi:TetR/AcrR family transcriptional regulator [Sulfitobacter donghicola]|uniref:Transcriptional regulator n=1 Tax=Sulfitobacter donghicola DSW-25 = KCTC 12864 = JCM 14565 TaxID=1300350 RepID=A0A073INI0_9RHOB|nr:TetR/AcrR family transcriptional regulator [Sulfitobacter donghicola]KEJ91011.1 transcriptional regulator [Sulfitobacter donghicola DSW-25 = KCTC 12864 = JCM 14565]KIN68305.1 Transcriptional regulatory protein [Sulfitobacter donghicola DSW-25 = KCTC 12864 = JCM 14565]